MEEICMTPDDLQYRIQVAWWLALAIGAVAGAMVGSIIAHVKAMRRLDSMMLAVRYSGEENLPPSGS